MAYKIARNIINKVEAEVGLNGRKDALINFFIKYFECEMAYKKVLNSYCSTNSNKGSKIIYSQIDKVLKNKDILIAENLKEILFSNNLKKRNNKSARVLRDSLVHDFNANDIEEVYNRNKEFEKAFNSFLKEF